MKNGIVLFFVLMLICSSCSTSSNDVDSGSGLLVSKIVSTSSSGGTPYVSTFSYSGNKITESNYSSTKNIYTYSGNNIASIKTLDGATLYYLDTFTYDSNGNVSSETINYYLNDFSEKKVFTYNSDSTISVTIYSGTINTASNLDRKSKIFVDAIGEITKIENYDLSDNLTSKTVYTNDGKNSPFKNILGFNKQPYFFGKYCNTLTSDSYNSSGQIVTNSTFQYVYNSNNFPTSCSQNFYNNGSLTSTTTIQYFY